MMPRKPKYGIKEVPIPAACSAVIADQHRVVCRLLAALVHRHVGGG